jgi:hypothetical protein
VTVLVTNSRRHYHKIFPKRRTRPKGMYIYSQRSLLSNLRSSQRRRFVHPTSEFPTCLCVPPSGCVCKCPKLYWLRSWFLVLQGSPACYSRPSHINLFLLAGVGQWPLRCLSFENPWARFTVSGISLCRANINEYIYIYI